MKIVDVNNDIKEKLRLSGLSKKMGSLEKCDFLVIEEIDGKIVGAGGLGGFLNVPSLQIDDSYQGKGIGRILIDALFEETRRRGYSYIAGSRNPENFRAIKLHDIHGFKRVFRVHYSSGIVRDVIILVLGSRGKIIKCFFSIFNTLPGTILLAFFLKLVKPVFGKIFTLPPEEFPDVDIIHMIKNFEKLKD
ncbi:GNAT family N-acetyltransferase [Candidatus Woesearchaeota archaeon]|nr:GNAT family N-acetyltransferase [Candidatus Woesearchaeota archaeon]